jgi:hypothetical protein
MNDELKNQIEILINEKMDSMVNVAVPNHLHNGWDSNQLDPSVALKGFPVIQVTDATVAPTDTPDNGIFRFYVDLVPKYYLWAWVNYQNASGVLVGAWKGVQLL